jgi:enterochelin esterase-like enzyme
VRGPVVVVGASLGGLTALLLGLLGAPRVGGVYSQSGSFFQVRHDDSESGYRYFGRISRLVQTVLDMRHAEHPLTVGMSCGTLEENVPNNRDMAAALRRAGHQVTLREVPDLHNYTAWRDAFEPHLTGLLARTW